MTPERVAECQHENMVTHDHCCPDCGDWACVIIASQRVRIHDLEGQLETVQEELEAMRETLAGPYFSDEDKRSDR